MSIQAVSWAIELQRDITTSEKMVLVILADKADVKNLAYPSNRYIAERAFMTIRSVQRCIATLERVGLISRMADRRKDRSQTSNNYILHIAENPAKNVIDFMGARRGRHAPTTQASWGAATQASSHES